jgi:hypothetical protein
MARSSHRGAFVLVEGRTADLPLFKNLVDRQRCQIQPAHGKDNVLAVMEILEDDEIPGVLGIVDADRIHITGNLPASDNVLVTDGCDLESMLLHSTALDRVLSELGSTEKIKNFETEHRRTVREHLAEEARILGALRYISERDHLALWFQELAFAKLVDRKSMSIDASQLVKTVVTRSLNRGAAISTSVDQLRKEIEGIAANPEIPSRDLSHGHDMVAILAVGLRQALGSRKQNEISVEMLERELRLAYWSEDFRSSKLFAAIRNWESRNPGYFILAESSRIG